MYFSTLYKHDNNLVDILYIKAILTYVRHKY